MSARIFRARYPHLEVVSVSRSELWRQVSISQVSTSLAPTSKGKKKKKGTKEDSEQEDEEKDGLVELVRCVPEVQRLLGSSVHVLEEDDEEEQQEEEEEEKKQTKPRGR